MCEHAMSEKNKRKKRKKDENLYVNDLRPAFPYAHMVSYNVIIMYIVLIGLPFMFYATLEF